MSQSLFTVSIYDTLGPDAARYIINHAELVCVITTLLHIPTLLKLAPALPSLKFIISMDPLRGGEQPGCSKNELLNKLAEDAGIKVYCFADVEALGAASQLSMNPPNPEDTCTINYTSGTTGHPKGVVLTHANAISGVAGARCSSEYSTSALMLSYLPLAHIYERVMEQACLATGTPIAYWRGDILGLVDDLKLVRPTILNSVPRLYNRFASAIRVGSHFPSFQSHSLIFCSKIQ